MKASIIMFTYAQVGGRDSYETAEDMNTLRQILRITICNKHCCKIYLQYLMYSVQRNDV